jgi:hypothetical protein
MNEKHYSILYALITVVVVFFASTLQIPALRIFSSSMQSVALWLLTNVLLMVCLYGVKFDVLKEIIEEKNAALAQVIGLFAVATAIVIHG